jgi:hypothetical protein
MCGDAMTSDAGARCLAQELRAADATSNATQAVLMGPCRLFEGTAPQRPEREFANNFAKHSQTIVARPPAGKYN